MTKTFLVILYIFRIFFIGLSANLVDVKNFFDRKIDRSDYHVERNGCFYLGPRTAVNISVRHFQSRKYNPLKREVLR